MMPFKVGDRFKVKIISALDLDFKVFDARITAIRGNMISLKSTNVPPRTSKNVKEGTIVTRSVEQVISMINSGELLKVR